MAKKEKSREKKENDDKRKKRDKKLDRVVKKKKSSKKNHKEARSSKKDEESEKPWDFLEKDILWQEYLIHRKDLLDGDEEQAKNIWIAIAKRVSSLGGRNRSTLDVRNQLGVMGDKMNSPDGDSMSMVSHSSLARERDEMVERSFSVMLEKNGETLGKPAGNAQKDSRLLRPIENNAQPLEIQAEDLAASGNNSISGVLKASTFVLQVVNESDEDVRKVMQTIEGTGSISPELLQDASDSEKPKKKPFSIKQLSKTLLLRVANVYLTLASEIDSD